MVSIQSSFVICPQADAMLSPHEIAALLLLGDPQRQALPSLSAAFGSAEAVAQP